MKRQKAEGRKTTKEVKKMRSFEDEKTRKNLSSQLPNFSTSQFSGFTLIEVIIAIAIIGVSLVLIMQLFAGGLRAARTSCDYSRAVIHAKYKMEDIFINPVQDSGSFDDGFKWEANVEPFKETGAGPFKLLQLKVKVLWDDTLKNSKAVELVGLKAVSEENEE